MHDFFVFLHCSSCWDFTGCFADWAFAIGMAWSVFDFIGGSVHCHVHGRQSDFYFRCQNTGNNLLSSPDSNGGGSTSSTSTQGVSWPSPQAVTIALLWAEAFIDSCVDNRGTDHCTAAESRFSECLLRGWFALDSTPFLL